MVDGPSILSLAAAALYLVVAGSAAAAGLASLRHRQVAWHRAGWGMVLAVFVGLALMRFCGVEELLRESLRLILYSEQSYEERSTIQKPLVAVVFVIAATLVGGLIYILADRVRGRRNVAVIAALGCTGGLIFLLALRLVSLHSVDALLYGPLKINWFADLGMALMVLVCAVRYCLVVGRPQG